MTTQFIEFPISVQFEQCGKGNEMSSSCKDSSIHLHFICLIFFYKHYDIVCFKILLASCGDFQFLRRVKMSEKLLDAIVS